jgi:peptidoglycan/xylan/chitin deacetylase (PgdA/CDA1 family)
VILAGCSRGSASPECAVGKTGIAAAPIKGDSMDEQVIALAFDGAPTAYTAEVAELLANKRLGATFFVVGRQVEGREAVLSAVRGGGHLIGNATYSGNKLTAAALPAGELRKADEVLTPYVVGNMFLLRAPDDAFDDDLAAYLNQQGLQKYVGPIGSDVVTEAGEAIDAVCWREALSAGQCAVRYVEALADKKKGIARFTDGCCRSFCRRWSRLDSRWCASIRFPRFAGSSRSGGRRSIRSRVRRLATITEIRALGRRRSSC